MERVFSAAEGCVLHQRRKRVGNGIAGHAEDPRRPVKLLDAVEVAQRPGRHLAGCGLDAVGEGGKGELRACSQTEHAAHQPLLAHGDADEMAGKRPLLDQLEDGQVVGQRLGR
jgi:hypothetical protein